MTIRFFFLERLNLPLIELLLARNEKHVNRRDRFVRKSTVPVGTLKFPDQRARGIIVLVKSN